MQFKHPELLYALLLLIIPIIVHLFQLRKFQKVPFTNVEFLKSISIQTRKSSQLKKWLTLITRMLLLSMIIIAFAQPYLSKSKGPNLRSETVIYLDNSFSMQAVGAKGELLKRSIQDIIEASNINADITVFTNDRTFKNTTQNTLRDELLSLDYAPTQLDYNAVLLKGTNLFSNNTNTHKSLVLISDFQQNNTSFNFNNANNQNVTLVKTRPLNTNNISIDSVYISKANLENLELSVIISNNGNTENVSVSLFNDNMLMAKSSVTQKGRSTTNFTLPNNTVINGKLQIDDTSLQFDNTLYFNINVREKVKVLSINSSNDDYLKRVYTNNEFDYKFSTLDQVNFNDIEQQNLIILNEIDTVPVSLINALNGFINNGGYLLIIPSTEISASSYNQLKGVTNLFSQIVNTEKKVTTIKYNHPILNDVFDKQISNFQYPKVNTYYPIVSNNNILEFEDGKPFLTQNENTFVFTAALNTENSNVINSPLIVPVLYNIGRQSLKLPKLYYTIGIDNSFDINTTLEQDNILKLVSNDNVIIPQQRTFTNKVSIFTNESPNSASIYNIASDETVLKNVSYNFSRTESDLSYIDLSNINDISVVDSVPEMFETLKNDTNVNELWKWFTIFALVLLVIEMLILKYFK